MNKAQIATLVVGIALGAGGKTVLSSATIGGDTVHVTSIALKAAPDGGVQIETCGSVQTLDRPSSAFRCDVQPGDACAAAMLKAAPQRVADAQKLGRAREAQIMAQLADAGK